MNDALSNHTDSLKINGRTITNLRFADDTDGLAGSEEELINLTECLFNAANSYTCETWTLFAELQKRILTFEIKNFRKLLGITYLD